MAQATGITVERSTTGIPQFVRIDLRKHAYFIPFLEEKGIEIKAKKDNSKNPAITGIPPKGYMTIDDFFKQAENDVIKYCDENDIL